MPYVLRSIDGSGFLAEVIPAAGTDVVTSVATQDLAAALRFDSEAEAAWQAGVPGMVETGWEVTLELPVIEDSLVHPPGEGDSRLVGTILVAPNYVPVDINASEDAPGCSDCTAPE